MTRHLAVSANSSISPIGHRPTDHRLLRPLSPRSPSPPSQIVAYSAIPALPAFSRPAHASPMPVAAPLQFCSVPPKTQARAAAGVVGKITASLPTSDFDIRFPPLSPDGPTTSNTCRAVVSGCLARPRQTIGWLDETPLRFRPTAVPATIAQSSFASGDDGQQLFSSL